MEHPVFSYKNYTIATTITTTVKWILSNCFIRKTMSGTDAKSLDGSSASSSPTLMVPISSPFSGKAG